MKRFDAKKEVRAIARERVGIVPSSKVITPKKRKPAKHKREGDEYDGRGF